ncbi:uncharacterized protein TNCV_1006471 [Trichonephila clavipes]|nr:uncharacterized protein TNCV_1006471 [Trichonephila clavipes]
MTVGMKIKGARCRPMANEKLFGAERGPPKRFKEMVRMNHGQVTWTTPELAPPLLTTTPHQREDVSALNRFNVHSCPTRWVFSGTGLEPVTKQATVRYLYHSATTATGYTRAFGDGPRNLEPWSSDVDDT